MTKQVSDLRREIAELRENIRVLEIELKKSQSANEIQQSEINLMAMIIERDLQRRKAEVAEEVARESRAIAPPIRPE